MALATVWLTPCYPKCSVHVDEPFTPINLINTSAIQKIGPPNLPHISSEARAKGLRPAALKDVVLRLKPGVNWLSETQAQIIKENASNGQIRQSLLPSVEPGQIYADPFSLLAFEFVKGTGDILYIILADEEKIVEEISIPDQTVFLNEANITSLTQGINVISYKKKSGISETTGFNFYFDERKTLPGYDKEGKRIEVALKGSSNVDSPAVEVKYTRDSGYKFIFFASQKCEVQAELLAQVKKDIKIPLYDFTVPAKGCKITVGFFLVLGVDGRITMEYSVKQSSSIRAGLQGDTAYYMPVSVNSVKEASFDFIPANLSLSADVKGETSLLAEVAFDILGKGKIILDNRIGVLLEAKAGAQSSGSSFLSIKGDGFAKISGRIKIKSFDKNKTIYEYKYPLFNYVKERSGGYNMEISEVCAYRDVIKGNIVEKATGKPYAGKEIQLKVISSSGSEKILNASTDNSGFFSRSYDLKKGDKVRVKIPGNTNSTVWSYPREADFPFNHVAIEVADYLTNTVKGYVSGSDNSSLVYNGPVSVYIERTNNIPLHYREDMSLPVEYAITYNVQSSGGVFQLQGADIRPYDKVYAVLEMDGFTFISNKVETEGITVCVDGGYLQEADSLSSQNSNVLIGYSKTASPYTAQVSLRISGLYPHSADPENTLKSKEWTLNFEPVQGKGMSFAGTGPWELDFSNFLSHITSQLDKFRNSFTGKRSVNYHVFESARLYYEGKKIEYFNEARLCEEERRTNLLYNIERTVPLTGASPQGYYLKSLEALVFKQGDDTSQQNQGKLSPKNCSADLTIKYYSSASSFIPSLSKTIKYSILNEQQKVEMGLRDPIVLWDKSSKTKVVNYREFPSKENVRYDLEDYIAELQNVLFVLKGEQQINGVLCQVWEKSKKIDPIMNIYVKVQMFIDPNNNLPVKVVFYDGYHQKIELIFSNWQKASDKGSGLFMPPFGEIRYPHINIHIPFANEDTSQSEEANPGGNGTENLHGGNQYPISIMLTIGDAFMTVNGNRVEIDPGRGTKPLIVEGRTIVPIRAIVEALGGSISWNGDERKITIARHDTVIEMWVNKKEMLVNGIRVTNDVASTVIGSRTYVPVRFVAENLNCDVSWNNATRTVTITTR